jgi:CrcB protein
LCVTGYLFVSGRDWRGIMREETGPNWRVVLARQLGAALARLFTANRGVAGRRTYVTTFLVIALGASVGANLRYMLSNWAAQQWGTTFPYGTLLINILGSFAIGFILVLAESRIALSVPWRLLIVTGLLGGFTTFSTFSYETYNLLVEGSWLEASLNLLGSVGIGLIGVSLGAGLARIIP